MTQYKPFQDSLPDGHNGEDRVFLALSAHGAQVQRYDCRGAFDLTATIHFGHPERIEVKNEDNYATSGNVCLELWQGKEAPRPSGIAVSESTVCVHTLGSVMAIYRTQSMRLFIKSNDGTWPLRGFGDNGNRGLVIPRSDLLGRWWFDVVDDEHLATSPVFLSGDGSADERLR